MSMFGKSPSIGRRAGRQAQIVPGSNFTPGQFAAPMPQPKQRPMVTANPPFAVNEPVQVKRPANAQLGSSTPMSQPAFREPVANPGPSTPVPQYPGGPGTAGGAAPQPTGPVNPGMGDPEFPGSQTPPPQTTPPMTMPSQRFPLDAQRAVQPTQQMPDSVTPVQQGPLKAPSLPEAMAAKAASGSLTMQDVLAARQAGDNILAESILQALAGNGWNYARPNRAPADPGFVAPAASWYDRSGAGPGVGAVTDLASQMAVKAQTGTLTAADALAAEQAGDTALAAAIRNAVAGLGWNYVAPAQSGNFMGSPPPPNSGVTYPQPPGQTQQPPRRYRTFAPGAAGGIYPG